MAPKMNATHNTSLKLKRSETQMVGSLKNLLGKDIEQQIDDMVGVTKRLPQIV